MRNHIGARPDRTDHLYGELNTAPGGVRHLASQCARTALDVYGDLDGVESRGCTLEVDGRDCTHEGLPATQNKWRYRAGWRDIVGAGICRWRTGRGHGRLRGVIDRDQ